MAGLCWCQFMFREGYDHSKCGMSPQHRRQQIWRQLWGR